MNMKKNNQHFYTVCLRKMVPVIAFALIAQLFVVSSAMAAGLMVPVGRSELIEVPADMGEVIVANPDVADIYVHGKRKVSVIGKDLGRTTIRVFDTKNKLMRAIDVTIGYDLPGHPENAEGTGSL